MKFNTLYSPPAKASSPHGGVSMTDGAALKDCDINTIIKRYNAGDRSAVRDSAYFGDVSEVGDFANALATVQKARKDFEAVPAEIRAMFGNDPSVMIEWLKDSANDEEAVKLGLKVRTTPDKSLEEKIVDGVTSALEKANEAKTASSV